MAEGQERSGLHRLLWGDSGALGAFYWIAQAAIYAVGGAVLLYHGEWWAIVGFPLALWALRKTRRDARRGEY